MTTERRQGDAVDVVRRAHTPVRTKDGWWCSGCLKSWKAKPRSACQGRAVYTWWDQVPATLKTKTQLGKEGLNPGPHHRAFIDTTKYKGGLYKLFDQKEAVPKRKVSPAQASALQKARETADHKRRTCPACKGLVEDSHELYTHRGVCYRCAEAQFNAMLTKDRQTSTAWAKALLANPDLVLLDFETTDLYDADIVQIGVLSARGEMLLETLVKPTKPISPGATAVHGITAEDVKNAPTFEAAATEKVRKECC